MAFDQNTFVGLSLDNQLYSIYGSLADVNGDPIGPDVSNLVNTLQSLAQVFNPNSGNASCFPSAILSWQNGSTGNAVASPGYNLSSGGMFSHVAVSGTNSTLIYGSSQINPDGGEECPLLGSFHVTNLASSTRWIHWFDSSTAIGVWTSPLMSYAIPASGMLNLSPALPWSFNNGIAFLFSTSGSSLVGVSAGDLVLNAQYGIFSVF